MRVNPDIQVKERKQRHLGKEIQKWTALVIVFVSVFVFFFKILFF